jgi:hypothetical protein
MSEENFAVKSVYFMKLWLYAYVRSITIASYTGYRVEFDYFFLENYIVPKFETG